MFELIETPSRELLEIERIINELFNDFKHPLNNSGHPYHQDSLQAVNDLMSHADNLRARLMF